MRARSTAVLAALAIAAGAAVGVATAGKSGSAAPAGAGSSGGGGSASAGSGSSTAGGSNGTGAHPAARHTAARDSFSGAITASTGRLAGRRGATAIYLHPASSSAPSRDLTVALHGRVCKHVRRCLRLSGTLTGKLMAAGPKLPADAGRGFIVTAAGNVAPVGPVRLSGVGRGTGFIAHSHEQLRITLKSTRGTITILARSALVGGFTSP